MAKSNIEELLELTNRLKALLEDPHPGLLTWREQVSDVSYSIGLYGEKPKIEFDFENAITK